MGKVSSLINTSYVRVNCENLRGLKHQMPTNKTITINGRVYDAATGLPINEPEKNQANNQVKRPTVTPATTVHSQIQRSQTLIRRATKKPAKPAKRPTTGRHMDMARSPKITKFAPHPVTKPLQPKVTQKPASTPDKAPQVHPIVAKAAARVSATKPATAPKTSKEIKNTAIASALAAPKAKPVKASKKTNKIRRRLLIIISVAVLIALGLFAVYRFIPSVSVSVASAQAGVEATYPKYIPDGYSLSHPVTYGDGEVTLKFKSNSNDNSYTITQTRSSWDSSAVLDNIVRPATGENYITTKERGLTVYSYNNNAAWVNGGVLYVISSDNAPLSGEQIRHIATSL